MLTGRVGSGRVTLTDFIRPLKSLIITMRIFSDDA